eukprot:512648-Rhodomonas_salina.1
MVMLDHPSVVAVKEVLETEASIFLVMEYCAGGHLEDYISPTRPMSEAAGRFYFGQLMAGVTYCHEKVPPEHHTPTHRHLPPSNTEPPLHSLSLALCGSRVLAECVCGAVCGLVGQGVRGWVWQGVCHRDLRVENLMLDNRGHLKITDFGHAGIFQQGWDVFQTMM